MAHSLNHTTTHRALARAHGSDTALRQVFHKPTQAEWIATVIAEDERRAHTHRARPQPSAPRRFSWEG